jgi:hypothetical protein
MLCTDIPCPSGSAQRDRFQPQRGAGPGFASGNQHPALASTQAIPPDVQNPMKSCGLSFEEANVRTHLSLDKNAPDFRRPQKLGPIAAISILDGLHHQYVRG